MDATVEITTLPGFLPLQNDISFQNLHTSNVDQLLGKGNTRPRAHETVLDLVCRLLLEKKKNNYYQLLILRHLTKIKATIRPLSLFRTKQKQLQNLR